MNNNKPFFGKWWVGVLVAVVLIGLVLVFLRNAPAAIPQDAQAITGIGAVANVPAQSDAQTNADKKKRTPTPAQSTNPQPTRRLTAKPTQSAQPKPNTVDGLMVRNVKIYDLNGNLAYKGDVDLKPTLDRIAKGIADSHRNDGSTFGNFERKLPQKARGYYTEYVVRTPGISGPGPQRVIMGKDGEAYYTPDHYATFVRIK